MLQKLPTNHSTITTYVATDETKGGKYLGTIFLHFNNSPDCPIELEAFFNDISYLPHFFKGLREHYPNDFKAFVHPSCTESIKALKDSGFVLKSKGDYLCYYFVNSIIDDIEHT